MLKTLLKNNSGIKRGIEELKKICKERAISLHIEKGDIVVVTKEIGVVFTANHYHCMYYPIQSLEDLEKSYLEIVEDIYMGIESCEIKNCPWCLKKITF